MPKTMQSIPKKPRIRVSNERDHEISFRLLLLLFFSIPQSFSAAKIPYKPHCNSIVISSTSNGLKLDLSSFLNIQGGFFSGGEKIFPQNPRSSLSFSKSANFRTQSLYKTETDGILQVQATLHFRGGSVHSFPRNQPFRGGGGADRGLPRFRYRLPKIFHQKGTVSFELSGYWSESSGKLCMVGTGFGYSEEGNSLELSVVFKLNYPKISNISTSVVTGSVESLDTPGSFNYFDPISVVGFSQSSYEYTMIPQAENSCFGLDDGEKSLGLEADNDPCSMFSGSARGRFKLDYGGDCAAAGNCSPVGGNLGFVPSFMTVGGLQCSDNGRLRFYLGFSNSSYHSFNVPLDPKKTLVGEGMWDGERKRLCVVGCRLLNFKDSLARTSVGDCSIRLTFRFPAVLSIRVRSSTVGRIWSTRDRNETGHFERIALRSSKSRLMAVPGLKYSYTQLGRVSRSCGDKAMKRSGKRYPDGNSFEDMRFDMSVKYNKRDIGWGHAAPLSIGDELLANSYSTAVVSSKDALPSLNRSLLNISYIVGFKLAAEYNLGGLSVAQTSSGVNRQIEISAEGVYDAETGTLCMVGCRYLGWSNKNSSADSMDCEILINVEFSSLNPEEGKQHLKGTIRSTRETSSPFYFEPLEMFSSVLYATQAKESIWRMDLEIFMVMISLTLACVFIGLQLFHVTKHPDVLPSTSLVMLIVLTLGHMIPLVLNFEAFFFGNRNRQNVLLWSGGWLEVNEVIVRLFTMVAFLLQFRLLQLTWSARLAEESRKGLWVAEKKALNLCLLLYVVGGLIALFVHWKMEAPLEKLEFVADSRHSIWEDLRSYAGLVLDGFLLPQIMFNIFSYSKDKTLAPSFYIGTTVVRSLPHVYDAYRTHRYIPHFNTSYIYANPGGDLYSTSWNVIIPCGGLLFCIGIYLQQRFGGVFILPERFRPLDYERVPVNSG
ncbi:hypothetical protein MRB53_020062 [Persea americana]|uniref:Uncharacterized protein n=1 Tax=Persea americana TaxID=3435 RepID=A0ACC2L0B8_PERAE|nr:hypothetical protein MRB53_020062 [Persea americana]